MEELKSYLLQTATGPVLVLTRDDLRKSPEILQSHSLGMSRKFLAYELPLESVRSKYSAHFQHVINDPKQRNAVMVLDDDGRQVYENIDLKGLGEPIVFE